MGDQSSSGSEEQGHEATLHDDRKHPLPRVDTAVPHESVRTAAQRMCARGAGTLVVTDAEDRVVGIPTDRELAPKTKQCATLYHWLPAVRGIGPILAVVAKLGDLRRFKTA